MSPEEFIKKWRAVTVSEIAASQSHFNDLCELIDEPKPLDVDPTGERYAFEKPVTKSDGRSGRADVWKKGFFAWEYKRVGRFKSLAAAYGQLKEYSDALENPELLIVCDISEIQVHTNFANTVKVVHVIKLIDLNDPTKRRLLKNAFTNPSLLKPETTREQATNDAAREVAFIARKLRDAGNDAERVAHFLNKLVFCMFAEDIGLLPNYLFSELLEQARDHPENFKGMAETLFKAMQNQGSFFGTQRIPWFNGGLFADFEVLKLSNQQIQDLYKVALLDWSAIEPPIFGTLFERGLDPEKRTQLASLLGERKGGGVGIHYTDPDKIMKIVEPVVLRPLRAEWEKVKADIQAEFGKKATAGTLSARTRYENNARDLYAVFLDRLAAYRVLDPACGSGNFLYVALLKLKDFEAELIHEAEAMGLPRQFPGVGPEAVMGIEINPYAAELARLVVWIGDIQWQLKAGYNFKREPILRPLNQIECRDALINPDGTEALWPTVDAIIGNPPFLGSKEMRGALVEEYVTTLRNAYAGRVAARCDLVMYWVYRAGKLLSERRVGTVGLVTTNKIRKGGNYNLMKAISEDTRIFEAWPDLPWVVDGAAVRVSVICLDNGQNADVDITLDGARVDHIAPDLVKAELGAIGNLAQLTENKGNYIRE
jgi:SAM-dependent methyltransferase